MSLSINTNTAAMAALQSLNETTADLNKTENAVSTGKSVNTASDNPAMYSIAQNMSAQVSTLSGVSTGLQFSAQVLNTATQGLSSISSSLQSLAATIGTNTTGVDNSTLNDAISKTLSAINTAASGATFEGVNLLAGQTGSGVNYTNLSTAMNAQGSMFTQNGFDVSASGLGISDLTMSTQGSELSLGTTSTATAFATNSYIQVENTSAANVAASTATATANSPAVTYGFYANTDSSDSQTSVLTAVAKAAGLATVGDLTSTNGTLSTGADTTSIVSESTASDGSTTYQLNNGNSITQSTDGDGNSVYTVNNGFDANGNVTTKSVIVDVNMSGTLTDSSTGGTSSTQSVAQVNLMKDAMENQGFGVSSDSNNNLTIAGNNISATNTQSGTLTTTTGAIAAGTQDTTSGYNPNAKAVSGAAVVSAVVSAAISNVTRTADIIGYSSNTITNLQSTTSSLSDALTTGIGALTDADLAAESAKLTSLQTKQQLAIQSLSIANSQSSTLLSLFRS